MCQPIIHQRLFFCFAFATLLLTLSQCGAPPAPPPATTEAPVKTETLTQTATDSNTEVVTTSDPNVPTFDNGIMSIIVSACAGCHVSPPTEGASSAFVLNSYEDTATAKGAKTMLGRIKARTINDTMPPADSAYSISADDKATLLAWVEAGGPLKTSDVTDTNTTTDTTTDKTSDSKTTSSDSNTASGPTPDYYPTVAPMLVSACAGCHTDPPTEGASSIFRLDVYADVGSTLGSFSKRDRILARIEEGTMPPTDSSYTLSDANKTAILNWVTGGAPKGDANTAPPPDPSLTFITPSASGATANESMSISMTFTDSDGNDTWGLFYTSVAGATADGNQISTGLATSTTSYSWDTSTLATGTYYVYVVIARAATEYRFSAVGSISISHPQAGNASPTVILTAPNGQESILRGAATTVSYTTSDPDTGDEAAMTYKVELSSNSGSTWTTLVDNHASTTYTWNIDSAQAQGVTYQIRVTADDGKGGIASDNSSSDFGIRTSDITYSSGAGLIYTILQESCINCHATGKPQANNFKWNSYSGTVGASALAGRILIRTSDDGMPTNASGNPKLTASEKEILQLWIWSGTTE